MITCLIVHVKLPVYLTEYVCFGSVSYHLFVFLSTYVLSLFPVCLWIPLVCETRNKQMRGTNISASLSYHLFVPMITSAILSVSYHPMLSLWVHLYITFSFHLFISKSILRLFHIIISPYEYVCFTSVLHMFHYHVFVYN